MMPQPMPARPGAAFPPGTIAGALDVLWARGMRVGSAIDVGCADGLFNLVLYECGFYRDCAILNVDANEVYRASLETIRDAIGAAFRICAVTETPGEVELTQGVHPYWSSLRPPDDPYWTTVNQLSSSAVTVPARTLDDLVDELKMPPPFILKMDIQGGELGALRGARRMLTQTDVVVVETLAEDFDPLYRHLSDAGFLLFDVTYIMRRKDQSLGWFYPIYLNRRRADLIDHQVWAEEDNEASIKAQYERRAAMLKEIPATLERLRAAGTIKS
jgi:FkbM family methyltransferase